MIETINPIALCTFTVSRDDAVMRFRRRPPVIAAVMRKCASSSESDIRSRS